MTTRHSKRIRDNEKIRHKNLIIELNRYFDIFNTSSNFSRITQKQKAQQLRKIYTLILKNIKLFHKFSTNIRLKRLFRILDKKGYEILHHFTANKYIEKIVEKPILDMVTYIYKYNETISRVSYKLSEQMNKDVSLKIISYM